MCILSWLISYIHSAQVFYFMKTLCPIRAATFQMFRWSSSVLWDWSSQSCFHPVRGFWAHCYLQFSIATSVLVRVAPSPSSSWFSTLDATFDFNFDRYLIRHQMLCDIIGVRMTSLLRFPRFSISISSYLIRPQIMISPRKKIENRRDLNPGRLRRSPRW